ncbi:hypothetical protein NPIL_320561 [Nephila pilipes]|uniref:Uncharacterized protein n=1 Tax=Nephila pilipes TaxID=299642 RepID=A0A8X6QYF0_NEPPI|nr:hypothetical protein NPIL_320561 [Nephila pilipes]
MGWSYRYRTCRLETALLYPASVLAGLEGVERKTALVRLLSLSSSSVRWSCGEVIEGNCFGASDYALCASDIRRPCCEVHGATALVYLPGRSSSVIRWLRGGVGGGGEGGCGLRYLTVQWEGSFRQKGEEMMVVCVKGMGSRSSAIYRWIMDLEDIKVIKIMVV